jgi:hypothetical protein
MYFIIVVQKRPESTSTCPSTSHLINYGLQAGQGPDALEEYLKALPLPREMDPIGYWLKQRKAGEATADPTAIALAQMALDYLSAPGLFFVNFIHA